MRNPMVAGNWKMHKTGEEAREFLSAVKESIKGETVEAVLCAPFTALPPLREALGRSHAPIKLGAQNMHWEEKGAYTGEISPLMLQELEVDYVILGHSERRAYFHETDAEIEKKVISAFAHGLTPILCVGETLAEREKGETEQVISRQLQSLKNFPKEKISSLVIAYEPVWAIGTGKTASAEEAARVIGWIRRQIFTLVSEEVSREVRILYGGSVNAENIDQFMAEEEIDGALVGGASLKPESFVKMVEIAGRRKG
ncbi:MAG: triose-phosphate isomerase [Thermicanus sp.]|nr:triose-phosphate isomerase [Thermicanus sp.]